MVLKTSSRCTKVDSIFIDTFHKLYLHHKVSRKDSEMWPSQNLIFMMTNLKKSSTFFTHYFRGASSNANFRLGLAYQSMIRLDEFKPKKKKSQIVRSWFSYEIWDFASLCIVRKSHIGSINNLLVIRLYFE